MYVSLADQLYIGYASTCSLLGLTLNCILLYLIIYKSPPFLSPYTVFLANTCVTQILYSLTFLLLIPRVISMDWKIVNIYLGLSQFLGPWWSYMIFVFMLHLAVNSMISVMLSMVFRCLSLRTLRFPKPAAFAMCGIGYIIPFTMVACISELEFTSDPEKNNNYTHSEVVNLHLYNTVVGTDITQLSALWVMFCVTFLLIPIYSIMYYCRHKILIMLDRPTFICSTSTTVNVRRLVKALTLQSAIPLFTIFPSSVAFLSNHVGFVHTQMYGYFIASCMSFSIIIDPLVTMYYVQPYRRHLISLLNDDYSRSDYVSAIDSHKSSIFTNTAVRM